MKKLFPLLAFLPFCLNAQSLIGGKNIVKLNLSSLIVANYNVTYERPILPHATLSLGIRYMPTRGLPVESTLDGLSSKSKNIDLAAGTTSNFAITPEFRFYPLGGMRGFYVAPYLRYANFDFKLPVIYNDYSHPNPPAHPDSSFTRTDANMVGKINSFSGGCMIGIQKQIFKKIVLDFWLVGGHVGTCTGNLTGKFNLKQGDAAVNARTQNEVQDAVNSINISPFKKTGTVSPDGTVKIDVSGPWYGLRALGINVGIRF